MATQVELSKKSKHFERDTHVSDRGYTHFDFRCCYGARGALIESSGEGRKVWVNTDPSEYTRQRRMDPTDPYYDGWETAKPGSLAARFPGESLLLDKEMARVVGLQLLYFSVCGKLPKSTEAADKWFDRKYKQGE